MNINPGGPNSGGGFGFRPGGMLLVHGGQAHPSALAWVTFALVLLLVLTVGAMIVARFARRGRHQHGGPRQFAFGGGPGRRPDPLDVLRWRYARGELTRDAFLEGVADLTAPGAVPPPPPPAPAV
jgi:uncharacterized membrane protein